MNEECRRLEAGAIEVEARIAGRIGAAGTASDTDGVRLEAELRLLHQRLEGLRQGMLLIRRAESRPMRRREQQFIDAMAKKYYSRKGRKGERKERRKEGKGSGLIVLFEACR